MPTTPDIHGIIAYPITPYGTDGIDRERLGQLVSTLVADGADAIAPLGSTGESAYLSREEWRAVVDVTIAEVAGRVPVIVGASDLTTAETVDRAVYAQNAGADSVMILPFSYWPLSAREITQHYRSISDALSIPIMAYNNPTTSGIDMKPELLVEMFATIDNVTMVKESTGDISRMTALTELTGGELPFYNGSNPLVLEALKAGARGWCTAAICLRPVEVTGLFRAFAEGDLELATSIYTELKPFLEFIVSRGLPTAVKEGLAILGSPAGVPRPPLLSLTVDDRATLASMLPSA
ncbi:dihydrodipicolinate synthase family protein [Subtercola frigoramans]|uniref:4-hydroxy-tetrahydrodipicolinate synthase n=1 Tax=Subtercola frigoramans TaxID=120298 RepID=A0ABS2L9A4_9MICO|nr:dihydrodipicolinate synthase family protein [Subtercola frigoramans]MBM7473681.1 4-hydroxy-tetrahydrodipicolinate synthase [Subtercola frigoramans]